MRTDVRAEQHRLSRAEAMDDEAWALHRSPAFRQLLEERKRGPSRSAEDSRRRAGITEAEWAAANAELDRLELLEQKAAEQGATAALAAAAHGKPRAGRPRKRTKRR